jgi:hypothetical protein
VAVTLPSAAARAEVPPHPDAHGREFRVDFSAQHLDVDADLGELSLSGDVVVTVGRYRLGGQRVRLKRGPRGLSVEGGGDIAFCACENPPVTLGYSSVTIAPPSDVLVEGAVLRAHDVPVLWLPYLWLRSPDRIGVMFPSIEWRGDDGLLLGSGVHLPFTSNQGRPSPRALDISAFGYTEGGVRIDAQLLTPQSTSFVRWDHLGSSTLGVEAHGAIAGESSAAWAYDIDASRGERGRSSLTSLEAAARRYDHARFGVGSSGASLVALGVAADAGRGDSFSAPLALGPFTELAAGGSWGERTSYGLELGAGSFVPVGSDQERVHTGETRALQRASLETSEQLGPALVRLAAFEQSELVGSASRSSSNWRGGGGLALSLPLVRRYGALVHSIAPQLLGRYEHQTGGGGTVAPVGDERSSNVLVATAGAVTSLGRPARGGAARWWLGGGWAGEPEALKPVAETELGADARLLGARLTGTAEPETRAAEATARVRVGARGQTMLSAYAEARTESAVTLGSAQARGALLPTYQELGAYDAEGLTTGAELTLKLWSALFVGGGADFDPVEEELLAVRSFVRYRHTCGCLGVSAFASSRDGRGGFDAGLNLNLMP